MDFCASHNLVATREILAQGPGWVRSGHGADGHRISSIWSGDP